jgi:hypothetical protein
MKAFWISVASVTVMSLVGSAQAADTRAGTCEDAKSQYDYFCTGKGDPNDIMANTEIACNNAKKNMAAACDDKAEPDVKYEFKDTKK